VKCICRTATERSCNFRVQNFSIAIDVEI